MSAHGILEQLLVHILEQLRRGIGAGGHVGGRIQISASIEGPRRVLILARGSSTITFVILGNFFRFSKDLAPVRSYVCSSYLYVGRCRPSDVACLEESHVILSRWEGWPSVKFEFRGLFE